MKIPKSLKIGGHTFKIIMSEKPDECGEIDLDTNTITIDKRMAQSQQEQTLFHEIFHAMNWKLSEVVVESLAEQIYQVLKDNKFI